MLRKILSWPVRVHLLLLVILLALPSIALIVHWGMAARDAAIEDAKDECLKFVIAVAGEQQAAVAGVQQLVTTLALLPEVKSRNSPAVDALLADLLKKNPLYANIVISYKSGLLWATAAPAGAPFEGTLSIAGRKYFQDAVRSGTFASGEFSIGRIGKKPLITFAQPITNAADELTNVIAVSLNLEHIQSLFDKIDLPGRSSFSLLDHRGVILTRNSRDPFSEQLVGKPDTREELFTRMVEGPDEGTYEAMGNDGKVRLTAYKKIRLPHESKPYLYVRSSIPKAMVVSKANAAMLRNMAALASVFAVGLILAVFIGKRMIADPIAKLKEASRQLAAGPAPANVSGRVKEGELGELAHVFDDMAEALLRREKAQLAAEAELRTSEERHKLLAETMLQGVVHQDSEGTIVSMNSAAEHILGKTRQDFLGSSSVREEHDTIRENGSRFPGPEHPSMVAFRTGQPVRDVVMGVFNPRENARRWISIDAVPVFRQGEEKPHEVYTVFADITDRKRAEEVLQATLQRFYLMLASMYSGVLLMTDEGKIEFINQAFCDYYGLKEAPTDLTGLASRDLLERIRPAFLHPDEAAARIAEILQRGQPVRGEEFAMQGGRTAMRDFVPLSVHGKPCGRLWIHVDITDLKRAEEELQILASVVRHSNEFINVAGLDGRMVFMNDAGTEMVGLSAEEVEQTHILQVVPGHLQDKVKNEVLPTLKEKGFWSGELQYRNLKTGRMIDVYATTFTVKDPDKGTPLFLANTSIDITERKRAEEALKEAKESLEQRVRERTMELQKLTEQLEGSRGDLRKLASELVMAEERERKRIAGVLHDEIAQTLAAARMRLDLLAGIPPDQQEAMTEAKALLLQSIQETRALMSDIGNPLLFDMGLKAACDALAKRLMGRHPVRIDCDIRDAYKHLDPDVKTILYQVVRESLNNVVKHSNAQNAHVRIDMENGNYRVTVADDGAGFDPRVLGAPTAEGGFGLYSMRERLLAIDGSLRIESAPGRGTVVTAILPAARD
jgi:PAS domain S-box-containing protein